MGQTLTKDKFDEKVALVPFSTCHYWMGQVNDQGYGLYNRTRAHRISYELHKGPIPEAIEGRPAVVRHKCDTPLCVNPDHLVLGTQADNLRDAAERKRLPRGRKHQWSIHSEETLDGICLALIRDEPNHRIAKRFGVSPATVSAIRHGKKERGRYEALGGVPATGRSDRQLSNEQALYAYTSNASLADVAARLGVSPATIHDIRVGNSYRDVTGAER